MYRHQGVSLDMLLKLVKVFGSLIYSSISVSSSVGVDIEAEQRCILTHISNLINCFSCVTILIEGFYLLIGAKA